MTLQAIKPVDKIWKDGKLVPWAEGNVHLITHALHYGYGAFEGLRAYRTHDNRTAIFRLDAHIRRFFDSAKILMIPNEYSAGDLERACHDTLRANKMTEGYLRPLIFVGAGALGFGTMDNPTCVAVLAWDWGAYLGSDGVVNGVRCKVSSYMRHHVDVAAVKAKVIGQYVNAVLAKREAQLLGFAESILLDVDGYVTEASGQNLFIARDGVVKTAPLSSSILPGITRDSIIQLCREAKITVVEERFPRDEMYVADEVFLTGTASEVTPVREVDHRAIGTGKPGPITQMLQKVYLEACRGQHHPEWLSYVEGL